MAGLLFAFEGLDQSGKQTQAELLRDRLKAAGRKVRLLSFPDYGTSIGEEIARAPTPRAARSQARRARLWRAWTARDIFTPLGPCKHG